jgi:predicted Zn finger-like uncharacterized protein
MSLATRCFACGTVFRVVQDQLKISEGWVRCGRCNEVFNALESLFDLEREAPPEWSPPEHVAPATDLPAAVGEATVRDEPSTDPPRVRRIDAQLIGSRRSDAGSTPATRVDERDRLEFPDAQFEPESGSDDVILPIHDTTLESSTAFGFESAGPIVPPEFVRHAQRRARWHTPAARTGLSIVGIALSAVLALQALHHFRDSLAARWPVSQRALGAWCAMAGCSIQPPRHIDDIAVESTALTRGASPDTLGLAVTLRNRGAVALALPSIDLSLTDAAGQLVARRMLAPSEWHATVPAIQAGANMPLQLVLTASGTRVAGYTVELFYP